MEDARKVSKIQFICGLVLLVYSVTVLSQSMDPKVTITETAPASVGTVVNGHLANDVWLNCFVENLLTELTVRWQRVRKNANGEIEIFEISEDMGVTDNMKWSIEKPTQYSWRLRIKALEVADEANYTCFVRLTGNNNRAEDNRTVLVTDIPRILDSVSSSDTTVKEGDTLPLQCNASGRPYPTIMWRREGNAILPGGGVRKMGTNLDISNIDYTARGRYICEAFNEAGEARRDIIVTVQHSPKLTPDPAETGQAVGYQRTLICHVDANPVPSTSEDSNQLYWSFESIRIGDDDRREFRIMEGAYGRLTYEMIIKRVRKSDYGVYTCHAWNTIGNTRKDVVLYETDEPQPDKKGVISASPTIYQSLFLIISVFLMHLTVL